MRGKSNREREKEKFRDKKDDMLQVCYVGGRGGAQIGRVCVHVCVCGRRHRHLTDALGLVQTYMGIFAN